MSRLDTFRNYRGSKEAKVLTDTFDLFYGVADHGYVVEIRRGGESSVSFYAWEEIDQLVQTLAGFSEIP